jgi:phosphatidylglycerol:prolipoprotein diacylglycerol transferase
MGIVAFSLGSLNIYWYGLVWALAICLGLLLTAIHIRCHKAAFEPVLDMVLIGLPLGLIFSRIVYVVLHWSFYQEDWYDIARIWQGGFSIYGALLGFILAVFLYSKYCGLDAWEWLDLMVPAIVLGIIISQVGNFVAQTVVGMPMPNDLPNDHTLAEYIEYRYRPPGFENYEYFKPVSLYQAGLQVGVFLWTFFMSYFKSKRDIPNGISFLSSMLGLAMIRFACGFWYLSANKVSLLHFDQIICLIAAALLLVLIFIRFRGHSRRNYQFYV